ncbi:MAG: hypothetical protein QOK24_2730 [Verrucomicrobiota bacterium]|jgi:transcriptional regulator with XRE-family HTH domain
MPQNVGVPSTLDRQFGKFLRRARGDQTYAAFSRKTGLPPSTLFRLEQAQQSATLGRIALVMKRLKVRLKDIFPSDY